jgi:hypothetical protein
MSIVNLMPSMMFLCSSDSTFRVYWWLIYSLVSTTGAVFLLFLKLRTEAGGSSGGVTVLSILELTLLPLGRNLLLLFGTVGFSSEILTSLRLHSLMVGLVSSMKPSLLILIWKSYIHAMR